MASISIIILTKNGSTTLKQCLDQLYMQKTEMSFEVIAIDSGSTDGTIEILQKYSLIFKTIPPHSFNYGTTKNDSLQFASGAYLIFLSQDAIPANNFWLQGLIKPMLENPEVAGVYSRQCEQDFTGYYERFLLRSAFGKTSREWPDYEENGLSMAFSNASSAIRRECLELVPFGKLPYGEDRVWANQVLKLGYKIVYNPESFVYHSNNRTLLQYFEYGLKNAITRRIVEEYKEDPKKIVTKFMNPSWILQTLHAHQHLAKELDVPGAGKFSNTMQHYWISIIRFLGYLTGSHWSYRKYLIQT